MDRLRSATRSGDAGIGLPELLVSVVLAGIVLLALGTTFAGSLRTSSAATSRIATTADLRLAMDTVARRLRMAVSPTPGVSAFEVADPRTVRFFAAMNKPGTDAVQPPTLVQYAITPDCLEERRVQPTGSADTGWTWASPSTVAPTCLARASVNADGGPLFTYFPSGSVTAVALSTPTTGVAAADLTKIRSVELTMGLKAPAGPVPATAASTRVTLVNLLPKS